MSLASLLMCVNVDDWEVTPVDGITAGVFLSYIFMLVYATIFSYFVVMYFYLRLDTPL